METECNLIKSTETSRDDSKITKTENSYGAGCLMVVYIGHSKDLLSLLFTAPLLVLSNYY